MKLINNGIIKFDRQFPIYNFFFPAQAKSITNATLDKLSHNVNQNICSRALYFHIPFCETICRFCPFTRVKIKNDQHINAYVEALITEMEIKSKLLDLKSIPIAAIFFGGGTPSLLSVEQILSIGSKIRELFDISSLKEFSFEIEVKSITQEKISALKRIGVTHPRFGLQTFSAEWRNIFNLTSTIDQIRNATILLNENFKYVSCDLLYGMNGQEEQEIIDDLDKAIALNTTNIDIYPIDNIVTQTKLHQKYKELGFLPTSAMRKFSMNILIDKYMRSKNFTPHNGHGYFRYKSSDDVVVTNKYSFLYHEHVYGYYDYDLLGFGVNAVSSFRGYTVTNTANRDKYISDLKGDLSIPCKISEYDKKLDESRPLILRLPYHGEVSKNRINLISVPLEIFDKLKKLQDAEMLIETADSYRLTKYGWYWYVNMMYYLMPSEDQKCLNALVVSKLKESNRNVTKKEILMFS